MLPETPKRPDGLTPATAICVDSVRAEYAWLSEHYPAGVLLQQGLEQHPEGLRDVMVIEVGGQAVRVYFDISSFFGRTSERPTAPCQFCGQPLRTAKAKQCRHCRRQWRTLD